MVLVITLWKYGKIKEKMMSKQTAVEMLFDYIEANMHEDNFNLLSAKQTALAMEKAQIEARSERAHV